MFYQASHFTINNSNFLAIGGDDINKIHKWLNAPDCSANFVTAADNKCLGTGQWIFELDTYKEWRYNPGILTTITQNLRNMNQKSPVWYHYFDIRDNTESKTSYHGFLLSLVQQMGLSSESIHPALNSLYKSKPFEQLTHLELEHILETMIKDRNDMTIAVDALDECQGADADKVLNWLAASSNQLRIVVTSRFQPELVVQNLLQLGGPKSRIDEDIASYLELKIHSHPRFKGDIIGEIKDTLNKGAQGIFRWVDCQMKQLQKCKKNKDVKEALKTLPATLQDTYDQALGRLERLPEREKEDVQHLLLWLLYAFEPLTKDQVSEIWKVDLFEQKVDSDEMELQVEKDIPSTFVTVGQDNIIQLAHASVKEYLISYQQSKKMKDSLSFNEHLAHDIMTQTTIIYLMQYKEASFDWEGLVAYAVRFWLLHASKVEEFKVEGQSQKLIRAILKDNVQFSRWEEMYIKNGFMGKSTAGPLYYGALNGLYGAVNYLIQSAHNVKQYVNAQGGFFGNALQAASHNGHQSIVKLLLENNAEVNAPGGVYGNALQAASYNGHQSIVKLLLENNAEVNAPGEVYGSALQAASYDGHQSIVKLLLENNAEVNAPGGFYGNALQAASYDGNQSIVKLLLENNAEVNAQGGQYGNALQAASYDGNQSIVKLLLENNAEVNAQGGKYGNALQAASHDGNQSIVKLLLENNADVNAQGGAYGNALQAASCKGNKSIVKLLLENNADVNAQGGQYGNAFLAASYNGHESIVKLLLENNADVNAPGGAYGNALQAASLSGEESIVKLLLENNADVNEQGGEYGNALQTASLNGNESIVKLLLKHGADVNAQGGYLGNALQAASYQRHEHIVKLLLENNANVSAQGGAYGNALQAASCKGNKSIVKLLLENNADVNTQGGEYGSALQAASYHGNELIVKLLLENNADVNTQGGKYGNALQAASCNGHNSIVKLLLENNAKVNAQGGKYGNALQAASYNGHNSIVKLLLENNADVNAQGREYGNDLQAASIWSHENIM
ncbi:ankyrin repeat-containing domain protein [Lentinula edodes]|nr:ankyrin repeat-containing domain protein [Lentinula edodes]